ncbi:hypothetical protein HELRODRAFT_67205, partial [Helobdella robusta]|uniref:GDP-fucose pyrophosphorylase domain-containing protein n=1 Tax=Helobdella robusta TaxID=6412 RepID=T1FYY1_HELRO
KFWDVVVLTALDAEQQTAYECFINEKKINKEIPTGVDYYVFPDPLGPKIGCGGATMNVIYHLNKIYNEKLNKLFILIINAGGFSQRMPTMAALGKIFMSLPFGSPVWQIFDLKLACYLPFLQNMNPGYFQASSDTIEVFNEAILENCEVLQYSFKNEGLTALAHPSTVNIGESHGVFVVDDPQEINNHSLNELCTTFINCSEVLQKPTLQNMEDKKAILKLKDGEVFVYTDSCFYFDQKFAKKLLDFYELEKPLTCEIDGYGDFMQSLGPNASTDFISDVRNVSVTTESLRPTRLKLFNALNGSNLNVIAFNESEFYHLGTMNEYLENLNPFCSLGKIIEWKPITSSYFATDTSNIADDATVIECLATQHLAVKNRAIIEYCEFNCPIQIGQNCIVSNCYLGKKLEGIQLNIPQDCMICTLPINGKNGNIEYVTLTFNINDDLKKVYQSPEDVKYFGKHLADLFTSPLECEFHNNIYSLWNCKLFSCEPDMHLSLLSSFRLIENISSSENHLLSIVDKKLAKYFRYSACEVMEAKNISTLIIYRKDLRKKISNFQ